MSSSTSSPRTSPRVSRPSDGVEQQQQQQSGSPQGIKVAVRYAETGDSQVLYFSETSTVEELKRQVMEYAEHGISCKMSSMILLQDDGSSLVKTSVPLNSLPAGTTVFMFARETLLKTFVPSVALDDLNDIEQLDDAEFRKELCERCLSRCRVQILSGTVALKNLLEHSKSVSASFARFTTHTYQPYLQRAQVLMTFDADLDRLDAVSLARNTMAPTQQKRKTMLDALPRDKIRKWADEATRQDELIQQKYQELLALAKSIDDGCESVQQEWIAQWRDTNEQQADAIDALLSVDRVDVSQAKEALLALKQSTTKALFSYVLRQVSSLQSKIQDLSNKVAALKEGIIVQDQKLSQIATIRVLPAAYQQALKEAERRRRFALDFSSKVSQLTDFVAKERDRELERREQFHRQYGKVLPLELVPGLTPWVFPVCEVTQRPIDPVLFANILQLDQEGEETTMTNLVEETKQEDSGGELLFEPEDTQGDHELSAMEVLELQAENEFLKSKQQEGDSNITGGAFEKLKKTHEQEVEMLKKRIEELEEHMGNKPQPAAENGEPSSSSKENETQETSLLKQTVEEDTAGTPSLASSSVAQDDIKENEALMIETPIQEDDEDVTRQQDVQSDENTTEKGAEIDEAASSVEQAEHEQTASPSTAEDDPGQENTEEGEDVE